MRHVYLRMLELDSEDQYKKLQETGDLKIETCQLVGIKQAAGMVKVIKVFGPGEGTTVTHIIWSQMWDSTIARFSAPSVTASRIEDKLTEDRLNIPFF